MDERLRGYVEDYQVRSAKYDGSPIDTDSARSEHGILDAFGPGAEPPADLLARAEDIGPNR